MRIFLVFLIGVWSQWIPFAHAQQDIVVGRVVSMDREEGTITIHVLDASTWVPEGAEEAQGSASKEKDQEITVSVDQDRMPREIGPQTIVRIWGEFSQTDGNFRAGEVLVQWSGGTGSDPTGVRRRLGGGRGLSGFNRDRGRGHGR
jgi:hypothetical protein